MVEVDRNGLIAIEKPSGVMSHPNKKGDLGKALLRASYDAKAQCYRVKEVDTEETQSVYLLNRLDSATSGIVLLALNEAVAKSVLEAFEKKQVSKTYCALVFGAMRPGAPVWRDRLSVSHKEGGVRASTGGGLSAETRLVKADVLPGVPLLSRLILMPLTGRTHQLRIQCSKRKIPIVGDRTYGDFQKNKLAATKDKRLKRLCLHCMGTELSYRFAGETYQFKAQSKVPF